MEERCEIRIYDRDFNWIAATDSAESVQFRRELYDTGGFEIHIHPDKPGAMELTKRGNIIILDRDSRKSGIIRDFCLKEARSGSEIIAYGDSGQGLAKQRKVVPPTKEQEPGALGYDRVTGTAEQVLKHYINNHMINPRDSKRRFDRLYLTDNLNRGKEFSWRARFSNLHEELRDIAAYSEMGWEIIADLPNKRWACDIIEGTDRTRNQNIHSPVTFRIEYQNISNYAYTENYSRFRNTGYAGGKGVDENRLIYTLGSENTGLDRWEAFLDCANAENITELKYYGEQKMLSQTEAKTIELDVLPKVFTYDKDYFLGDKVSVFISRMGIQADIVVTSVKEIWEPHSGYKSEIRLGSKVPNVLDYLTYREEVY